MIAGQARAGNQIVAHGDYCGMDCDAAREALSAALDGELPGVERAVLDAHLGACAGCRIWRERAHELTRRVRLAAASPAPAPGASLMSALRSAERPWWRSLALTRAALVLVAVGQLIVTIPPLLFGTDHSAPMHVAHELGAFDMALAVGFLVAALRPSRAQGMRTLVGCAALLLAGTAVIDLITGRTTVSDELPHLLAIAGWLLLRRISVLATPGADEPLLQLDLSAHWLLRLRRRGAVQADALALAPAPGPWETEPAREERGALSASGARVARTG